MVKVNLKRIEAKVGNNKLIATLLPEGRVLVFKGTEKALRIAGNGVWTGKRLIKVPGLTEAEATALDRAIKAA